MILSHTHTLEHGVYCITQHLIFAITNARQDKNGTALQMSATPLRQALKRGIRTTIPIYWLLPNRLAVPKQRLHR